MSVTTTSGRSRVDGRQERVEVVTDGHDLDLLMRLEQAPQALSDEVLVLGEHDANRHSDENTAVPSVNSTRASRRRQLTRA